MNHCFTFVVYNVVYYHILPLIEGRYNDRKGRRGSVRNNILNSLTAYILFLMYFRPKRDRAPNLLQLG